MNPIHHWLCGSAFWRRALQEEIMVPWALESVSLGENLLELGPGPGLTTALLQALTRNLTAVEIDFGLASRLADRLETQMSASFRATRRHCLLRIRFTSAASFTMLHHLPGLAWQNRMFVRSVACSAPRSVCGNGRT